MGTIRVGSIRVGTIRVGTIRVCTVRVGSIGCCWVPLGATGHICANFATCRWEPLTMLNPHFVAGEHGLFGGHESEDIRTIFFQKYLTLIPFFCLLLLTIQHIVRNILSSSPILYYSVCRRAGNSKLCSTLYCSLNWLIY